MGQQKLSVGLDLGGKSNELSGSPPEIWLESVGRRWWGPLVKMTTSEKEEGLVREW